MTTYSSLSRRTFLRGSLATAGLTVAGGSLAACGSDSSDDGGGSSSASTVAYWDWYVSQGKWVGNEIKLFEKKHSDITIKKTTQVTDKYADLFALGVRSKEVPDIFMIPQAPTVAEQVQKGWLAPLDNWADDEWKARFPENSFVEGINVFDGKMYSAPFSGIAPSQEIYIHNEIFRKAGLTEADGSISIPRTWDDVTRAADTIRSKIGGKTYGIGFGNGENFAIGSWWLDMFVRGAGSPGGARSDPGGIDYREGKWTFSTDRNYLDFFELLLEWKDRELIHPNVQSMSDEQSRAAFERGEFGMTIGGVWNQPTWTEHDFTDYSLMTLPSPSGEPQAFFYGPPGGRFLGISPDAAKPDAAWAWFDWMYQVDTGRRWVEDGQGLSVFPEANDPEGIDFDPFAQYVAIADMAKIGPQPTIRNPDVAKIAVDPVVPSHDDVATGIYTGQIGDIQTALSELDDRCMKGLEAAIKVTNGKGAKVSLDDYVFSDWDPTQSYTTTPAA